MRPHRALHSWVWNRTNNSSFFAKGKWLVPALARIFDKHLDIHHDDVMDASRPELLQELQRLYRDNRMFSISEAVLARLRRRSRRWRPNHEPGENIMSNAKNLDEMRAWLTERISAALKVKNGMDPDAPFSKYGLQSIDAVILAMEIEEQVGVELPPTLLWEYNTVNECASYLVNIGSEMAA